MLVENNGDKSVFRWCSSTKEVNNGKMEKIEIFEKWMDPDLPFRKLFLIQPFDGEG